ncbi:MAG: NAD-binding protein, partial [Dehalococcoidia bacterium]
IGCGSVCKLVHNCMSSATRFVMLEGFTLGVKAGVDPMALWRAARWGMFGRRAPIEGLAKNLFAGKFDPPTFALKLASKDVSLAVQLARECQVPMPLTSLAEQELLEAMARGWGERDHSATDLLQEERAGVEVRIPDFSPE